MEIDFCAYLGDPVYADDDPALWQGRGGTQCFRRRGSRHSTRARRARRRGQNWRSPQRDLERQAPTPKAHEVTLADDCVVLDGVSQIGPGELWVTAQIVVEQTPWSASGGILSGSPAESLRNPARSSLPEKRENPRIHA